MLATSPTVQPVATRVRLASRSETRRGSLRLKTSWRAGTLSKQSLLACLFVLFLAQPSRANLAHLEFHCPFAFQAVNVALAQDLPILVADSHNAEREKPPASAEQKPLLPEPVVRAGGTPVPKGIDWGRAWGFLLGLALFWSFWLIAAWERPSPVYVQPLYQGETAPAPKPPHILFSLPRLR